MPASTAMPGRPPARPLVNVYIDGYNFYVPLSTGESRYYDLCWCDFEKLAATLVKRLSISHPREFGGCGVGAVKYFTATIPENMPQQPDGIDRKYQWLDAVHYHSGGRVEIVHGTFRPRTHRFYIERDELDGLARSGIALNWDLIPNAAMTFRPKLRMHEEKQTDVMLATALVTDAALQRVTGKPQAAFQTAPLHRENRRPTPSACNAAIVISADIDFLPAAEVSAGVFNCPVAMAFTFPHAGYRLSDLSPSKTNGIFTVDVSEEELRSCRLPDVISLPGEKKIDFRKYRSSHFARTAGGAA